MKRSKLTSRWNQYFAKAFAFHAPEPVPPGFDEATDDEIEAISAEIGASGARRPPSE